jgi:hypothetical protein
VLRTSEIVEADEAQMARARALPCGAAYGGTWLRYTVFMTWRCPGSAPGTCPYAKNTIYGFNEEVPDSALLTHERAGSIDCTDATGPKHREWKAGDPIDILDGPVFCDGYYSRRAIGTHLFPDPGNLWVKEAMKRYATARVAQGYSFARIDEATRVDQSPAWVANDVHQYQGPDGHRRFKSAEATALRGMRSIPGWTATCPGNGTPWDDEAMILNRAGGCATTEGLPAGGGIFQNYERLSHSQLRAKYGTAYQVQTGVEKNPDEVPNNVGMAIRYEATERNVRGVAQVVKQARVSNSPNLYWFLDCPDIVAAYGADLQDAVGYGGDVVMCTDHWGALRDPMTGRLPPWFQDSKHRPTWSIP